MHTISWWVIVKKSHQKYIKPKKLPAKFPHIIEVGGKPYDVGYEVGSKAKDLIKKTIDKWFEHISTIPRETVIPSNAFVPPVLTKEEALSLSAKYLPSTIDYAPDLIEECRGIADGANVSFDEIFNLNCYLDIWDVIIALSKVKWKYLAGASGFTKPSLGHACMVGCTDLAVSGKATRNKKDIIIGQSFDIFLPDTFQECSILLKLVPEVGPAVLCHTIAGMIGVGPSLNSTGIGLVINKLFPSDFGPGVPYCFLVRKALQKETISEALDAVISPRRASGYQFTLCNSSGDIFGLEFTATEHDLFSPTEGIYGHTNHYVSPKLKPFDMAASGTSYVRLSRIKKHLVENQGEITIKSCQEWFKDHVSYPYGICRHGSEEEPMESGVRTVTAFIALPRELRVLATYGNPCVQPYSEYEVPNA
jgi:isopenicillin-N N-acyltransferase-like protein